MQTNDFQNSLVSKEVSLIVRNYNNTINILDGLLFRQRDVIRFIEFYTNSKYLGGMKDNLGRDKPFFNIINGFCDVENAAKDIDTKDITIVSDDGNHYTESFLMSKEVYEWMKGTNFAKTLNDMRDTHTRYGSLLVKKYTKTNDDGTKELCVQVPEWKNMITDQINIIDSPIIEIHYMTPTEMLQVPGWENVQEAIAGAISRGYTVRIPVYEVRGTFPLSFYKQMTGANVGDITTADAKTFSYQLYYLAGEYGQPNNGAQQDANNLYALGKLTPLYWENDTERVYKYLARKKRAGRAFGVGVVEEGEEAQVWTNDAVLKQFRAMEFTTKVIGQSASKKLKGRNMLNEVEDGQILEHEANNPISMVSLLPAGGLSQYQGLLTQWYDQFEKATSSYAALRGESTGSRTAYRAQQGQVQQASAVVKTIQQEFGIFITEIFEDWIMPYLAKQLNAEHILSHEFSLQELKEIDSNFATNAANDMAKDIILGGGFVSEKDYEDFIATATQNIGRTKAHRFLTVPKGYYKKVLANLTVVVTGENRQSKADSTAALLNIMKIYTSNPELANDPVLNQIFMQLVEIAGSGISPVNLISAFQEKAQQQANSKPTGKVAQSINYKDLPPEGQQQMAAEAGIQIQPPQPETAPIGAPAAPAM